MIDLREQIEDHIVKLLEISQTWPDDSDLRNAQSRHSGDHILALIADAMLSWDAVRAAVDVMDDRTGFHEQEYAHDTIAAALAAAGIRGTGQEGGEG